MRSNFEATRSHKSTSGAVRVTTPPLRRRDVAPPSMFSCSKWWSVVFYGPALVFSGYARMLAIYRNTAELYVSSMIKGTAIGLLQDAAILLQTLILVRCIVVVHSSRIWTLREDTTPASIRLAVRFMGTLIVSGALVVAYLWMTLACLVDLSLVLSFLPRLNRAFVQMYIDFSDQFASSIDEHLTPSMILGLSFYALSCVLWVMSIMTGKVSLPKFTIPYFQTTTTKSKASIVRPQHDSDVTKSYQPTINLNVWALLMRVITSTLFRTSWIALVAFVGAVHSSLAILGAGNDLYLMSNSMFYLQAEELLQPPEVSHASTRIDHILAVDKTPVSATMEVAGATNITATNSTGTNTEATTEAPRVWASQMTLNTLMKRMLGDHEVFELPDLSNETGVFPFWRKTLKYTGPQRFALDRSIKNTTTVPPPNVLLINMESFRSLEIGVIGGREKKAKYNQTVTPFFDQLSKSGVLFRQHYTPCVQTSRTLITTLFGTLPSFADRTALSTYGRRKFHMHGIPRLLKQTHNYESFFWSSVNLKWDNWQEFLIDQGFDRLYDLDSTVAQMPKDQRDALTAEDSFSWGRHDKISFRALEYFLEARAVQDPLTQRPLFMDIYSISSHDPYKLPKNFAPSTNYSEYLTKDNTKYVNTLNYADQALEQLITGLRRKGLMNNTIILIEGDHGNGRMEHKDNPTMGSTHLYDEGSHIPMLIIADGLLKKQYKGVVVDSPTSQIDILATVADMLEIEGFMQHGMGRSLMRESGPEREVILENPYDGKTKGIKTGELKYAFYGSGRYEVYNMTADPLEWSPITTGRTMELTSDDPIAEKYQFLELIMDIAQNMHENDGFVPTQDREREPVPETDPITPPPNPHIPGIEG